MMNKLHGIIFAYLSNPDLRELTQHRNTCSIPYGGQYLSLIHILHVLTMSPSRCIIYTNNFHLFWSYFITNDKDLLAPSPLFGDFCQ